MYQTVQTSTIPIIASLVNCTSPSLKISMGYVGRQSNGSDCRVLSIPVAYDLCAGNNPSTVVYEHELVRQHLKLCLISLTRFPIRRTRETVGLVCTKIIPHDPSNPYAECTSCKGWFHRTCVSVPQDIFISDDLDWHCQRCSRTLTFYCHNCFMSFGYVIVITIIL